MRAAHSLIEVRLRRRSRYGRRRALFEAKSRFSRRICLPKPPEVRPLKLHFLPRNERFQSLMATFPSGPGAREASAAGLSALRGRSAVLKSETPRRLLDDLTIITHISEIDKQFLPFFDLMDLRRFGRRPKDSRPFARGLGPRRAALDRRQNIAASSMSRRCAVSRAAVTSPAAPAVGPMATKRTEWTPTNRRMSRK